MSRSALAAAMQKAVGDEVVDKPLVYLDTGYPPLNFAVSGRYDGGLPCGRIYEISGGSSTGKTALATKLMVEAQKQDGFAIFIDWEHSFSAELAKEFGLKVTTDYYAYDKSETWESGNTKALTLAKLARDNGVTGPIVCVLDSIAAAMPKSMLYDAKGNDRGIDEFNMNDTTALSRVTSTTLKAVKAIVDKLGITMIYLNQTRTKPGVTHGDPTTTPGGSAMEFYADARLRLTRAQIKEGTGSDAEFVGQQINAKAIKSKFTAPFKTCSLRLMFNGESAYFDVEQSLLEHLKELKRVPTSGNYIVWEGKNYYAKALAEKIRKEGKFEDLRKLLPMEEA